MIESKIINNPEAWDQALAGLPYAHALQSWAWGEFKARWGWSAERLLWVNQGQAVAAAQLLARSIPRTPWQFLYVSKGPALDYADAQLTTQVLSDLEAYALHKKALFIKIDPDVPRRYGENQQDVPLEPVGETTLTLLQQRGWQLSPEQIQFRNTVIIDLAAEPEVMLTRMKSKWRYNIRLAGRKGVTIRSGSEADLAIFYQMYAETAARDGFLIRPQAYYQDVWAQFMTIGQAEMLLATVQGEIVAGLILFIFGRRAWYMYGASSGQHRNSMPNHVLQWHAMNTAQSRGCTGYDMWGAPDTFAESDSMWGVYRFKRGFGGQVLQGLGAYDYPIKPLLYKAFISTLPQARSLLRQWRG